MRESGNQKKRVFPAYSKNALSPIKDARRPAFRLGQMPARKAERQRADQPEVFRHMVAGLDFAPVQEGFGKTDPAGPEALRMRRQHDIGRTQAGVINIPVRRGIAVHSHQRGGIVKNIVGINIKYELLYDLTTLSFIL